MLSSLGYRAEVAANGFDAMEAIGRNDYAAVLMDCQMPVMDGYEATARLREREGSDRHTCVIAVTATAMATDRARCLAAGMDDYLVKPLTVESLAAVLARWTASGSGPMGAAGSAHRQQPIRVDRGQADPETTRSLTGWGGAEGPALDAQVVERLERLGADAGEDLMGELSAEFLADADNRVLAMRDALANDDASTIVSSAHTLIGASANIGASALAGLWARLEAEGAAGNMTAGRAQLDALETELARVRSALSARPPRR
jgi:CheY-like chemotaxis protein/HPt (histidine-containing phosphotransfer) domain-containing protein